MRALHTPSQFCIIELLHFREKMRCNASKATAQFFELPLLLFLIDGFLLLHGFSGFFISTGNRLAHGPLCDSYSTSNIILLQFGIGDSEIHRLPDTLVDAKNSAFLQAVLEVPQSEEEDSRAWKFELVVKTTGMALSREMAEMVYSVDYYIHVETREAAVQLVQHMPYRGHALTIQEVNAYAGPVIEQAVNQVVQITPLEAVNEKIHDLSQIVFQHLQQFLTVYGIALNTVKVLVFPRDERMKALISLKAFGLSEIDAVRYYTAMMMAERGIVSAPNMAIGQPFNINGVQPTATTERYTANASGTPAPTPVVRPQQVR
jgi:hypothetical protein